MKKEELKRKLIKTAGAIAMTGALLGTSSCTNKEEKVANEENKFYIEMRSELQDKHGCTTPNHCAEQTITDYNNLVKEAGKNADKKQLKKAAIEKVKKQNHNHGDITDETRGDRLGL